MNEEITHHDLIQVKDAYNNCYWIKQEHRDRTDKLIPVYTVHGEPRMREVRGRRPANTDQMMLHPSNICNHSIRSFVEVEIFGDKWRQCPTCKAAPPA